MFSEDEAKGNIEAPTQNQKKLRRNHLLYVDCLITLLWFQGAQPDHVQVESSFCYFPTMLVSFVHPRELVSFVHPRE